jgi:hypothetical protein
LLAGSIYILLLTGPYVNVVGLGRIEEVKVPYTDLVNLKALPFLQAIHDMSHAENAMIEVKGRVIRYHNPSS